MKIYVSTVAENNSSMSEIIQILASNGVYNIELSGGTNFSNFDVKSILALKSKYNLNYLCHNYFPPPENDFIINLASLNNEILDKSIEHIKTALTLSNIFESDKFACHSGFFIDFSLGEIGNRIFKKKLYNVKESIKLFKEVQVHLNSFALEKGVKLYFENNVISYHNYRHFNNVNPFMFTDMNNMKNSIIEDSNILLDVAHLKVSCKTLDLNFIENLKYLSSITDYWHISDNNGISDSNSVLETNSTLINQIRKLPKKDITITLEIKGGIENVKKSIKTLNED